MAWALQSKDVDAETCTALGKSAASIFHVGMASPSITLDALIPNTGTRSESGVTVAAGCRASNQFQTP